MDLDLHALERVYGHDERLLAAQQERYARALDEFARRYGPGEVRAYHAPGRVNLIGEHTDYNQGYVMPVALDRDVLLLARPREDSTVRLENLERGFAPRTFEISPSIPPSRWVTGPTMPRAGPAPGPRTGRPLCGYDGLVDGGVPYGVPRGRGFPRRRRSRWSLAWPW